MATPSTSPLLWILRRPLRRPGAVATLLGLSFLIAPLRVATLASLLPMLRILLRDDWQNALIGWGHSLARVPFATTFAEHLASGSATAALTSLLAAAAALALLRGVLVVAHEWLAARLVHDAAGSLATDVHEPLLRSGLHDLPDGGLLTLFTADLDAVRVALRRVYVRVLREPLNLLAALGFLLWLDWRLALWSAVTFPPAAAILLALSRRLKRTAKESLERTGALVGVVEECLRGRRVVRAFGLEAREGARFGDALDEMTEQRVRLDRNEALSSPLLEWLAFLGAIACCGVGVSRVLDGTLTPEAFLTFYVVLVSVLDPLRKLADTHVRLQRGGAAATRLREAIDRHQEPPAVRGDTPWPASPRTLRLDGVGADTEDGTPLLEALHFEARRGEVLLLAGRSGAGKSTLLDILAGLRSPDRGEVTLDGHPLVQLEPQAFRQHVALVAQETFLFRGSLRANVTLDQKAGGVPFEGALERAGLGSWAAAADDDLSTRRLSAGERQRISLARALYRDPDVLLLDEATAALDRPTEERILADVFASRHERITVVVTHRLGATLPVDRIAVLSRGRLQTWGPAETVRDEPSYRCLLERTPG